MNSCPVCHREGALLLVVATGFWERHVLSRFGWRPYRCRACGHRILRRPSARDAGTSAARSRPSRSDRQGDRDGPEDANIQRPEEVSERFLAPPETTEFETLIQRLAEDERALGLEATNDASTRSHDA